MFVKPYFQSKNTYDVKPDELKAPIELDKLKAPSPTSEVPQNLIKPIEPIIKYG